MLKKFSSNIRGENSSSEKGLSPQYWRFSRLGYNKTQLSYLILVVALLQEEDSSM